MREECKPKKKQPPAGDKSFGDPQGITEPEQKEEESVPENRKKNKHPTLQRWGEQTRRKEAKKGKIRWWARSRGGRHAVWKMGAIAVSKTPQRWGGGVRVIQQSTCTDLRSKRSQGAVGVMWGLGKLEDAERTPRQ